MKVKIKKAEKTILIYGLTDEEFSSLKELTDKVNINCRKITDTETTLTIADLVYGKNLPEKEPVPINGKFALIDGFSGNEQEATRLINSVSKGVIKAVRTVHNSAWRFCDLCGEIKAENDMMFGKKA